MGDNDIRQIKVGQHRVGIIGLKSVLQEVSEICDTLSDEDIKKTLLERLSKKNYISSNVRENYEQAFFREFMAFIGKPLAAEKTSGVLEIKVLGQGCPRCDQLERDVIKIVSDMNLVADIEHVRDLKEIAQYGVMGSPALVINGQVKAVGSIPPKQKIMDWLTLAGQDQSH